MTTAKTDYNTTYREFVIVLHVEFHTKRDLLCANQPIIIVLSDERRIAHSYNNNIIQTSRGVINLTFYKYKSFYKFKSTKPRWYLFGFHEQRMFKK